MYVVAMVDFVVIGLADVLFYSDFMWFMGDFVCVLWGRYLNRAGVHFWVLLWRGRII